VTSEARAKTPTAASRLGLPRPVCEGPEAEGAQQAAKQSCAEYDAECARHDAPIGGDIRSRQCDRLRVKTIDHGYRCAQCRDADLRRTESAAIDEGLEVTLLS
jgi:hypothetical protein